MGGCILWPSLKIMAWTLQEYFGLQCITCMQWGAGTCTDERTDELQNYWAFMVRNSDQQSKEDIRDRKVSQRC